MKTPQELIALMGIPFSDEQIEAITAPVAPGVIIAGAGTGKTTVMAARVVWLVATGQVEAHCVLGLTFTRKASGELSSRVRQALSLIEDHQDLSSLGLGPQVMTYDSFAGTIMTEFGSWLGVPRSSRIISPGEAGLLAEEVLGATEEIGEPLNTRWWGSLAEAITKLEASIQSHLVTDSDIVDQQQRFITQLAQAPLNRLGNMYAGLKKAQDVCQERINLLTLCQRYRELKTSRGLIEFSDQMAMAVDVVRSFAQVGQTLRQRYHVVVVDEYQDTSPAQVSLLSGIFGRQGGIDNYPITAVGDPLQAIYTWRAAAADSIYSFTQEFPSEEPKTYTLSINRRSGPEILSAANTLSQDVRADPLLGGHLATILQTPAQPGTSQVYAKECETWEEEAQWIAQSIAHSHHIDHQEYGEIAILVRQRKHLAQLVRACSELDIPVCVSLTEGLLAVEPVNQVIAMMKLLVDPEDHPAVVDILVGPRFNLARRDLELLNHRRTVLTDEDSPKVGLLAAVRDPGEGLCEQAQHACGQLAGDLEVLSQFTGSLVDVVNTIIVTIGLDVEMHHLFVDSRRYLQQFLSLVGDYASHYPLSTLSSLLIFLQAEEEYAATSSPVTGGDGVNIMTVHQAKGLEWDQVYLPAMVETVFPHDRVNDNPLTTPWVLPAALRTDQAAIPQITEVTNTGVEDYNLALKTSIRLSEDRLAYVGLTRARRKLYVSCHRQYPGLANDRRRSDYFSTVSQEPGTVVHLLDESTAVGGSQQQSIGSYQWPPVVDSDLAEAASLVMEAVRNPGDTPSDATEVSVPEEVRKEIDQWNDLMNMLTQEETGEVQVNVRLPAPLSASDLMKVAQDQKKYLATLVRPMPQEPSRRAQIGSLFHEWVKDYYRRKTSPGHQEAGAYPPEIAELCRLFVASDYARGVPCAVEEEFFTTVGGHAIVGRVDAVFDATNNPELVKSPAKYLIVDWKTGYQDANRRQLAIYAHGWAVRQGVDPDEVAAGFYYVRDSYLDDKSLTEFDLDELLSEVNEVGQTSRHEGVARSW
ncbi:MAG: ATP-dependent helicase [Propionibacteriaceae bacterium]|nr:ATP-dependent helicase [Propionibacteriaceae bacterium]